MITSYRRNRGQDHSINNFLDILFKLWSCVPVAEGVGQHQSLAWDMLHWYGKLFCGPDQPELADAGGNDKVKTSGLEVPIFQG